MKKIFFVLLLSIILSSAVYARQYKKYTTNPLYDAVKNNNWIQLKRYASKKYFYIKDYRSGEDILLLHAFRYKRYKMTEYLLRRGYNVNHTNYANATLLYNVTGACNDRWTKLLLKYKANVNISRDGGYSPLHRAATCNKSKILKRLLKKGAIINRKDVGGSAPIDYAAAKKRLNNIKILIRSGSKYYDILGLSIYTGDLKTVEFLMIKHPYLKWYFKKQGASYWVKWYEMKDKSFQREIADLLIKKGLKLTYMFEKRKGHPKVSEALISSESIHLKYLIKKGLPLNYWYKGKDVSLILAVTNIKMMERLIAMGAKINKRKMNEILVRNSNHENKTFISFLIRKGANISIKDRQGRTILYMIGLRKNKHSYIRFLLKSGVNVNSRDRNGNTAVHYWLQYGCKSEYIPLMLQYGFKKSVRNYKRQRALDVAKWRCNNRYYRKKYIKAASLLTGKSYKKIVKSISDVSNATYIGWRQYTGRERKIRPYSFSFRRKQYKKFNWKLIIKPTYGFKYVTIYIARQGQYYRKIQKREYIRVYYGRKTEFDARKYFKKYGPMTMLYIYLNGNKYSTKIEPVKAKFYIQFK